MDPIDILIERLEGRISALREPFYNNVDLMYCEGRREVMEELLVEAKNLSRIAKNA